MYDICMYVCMNIYVYAWISWHAFSSLLHLCLCATFVSEREKHLILKLVLLIAKIMNEIRFSGKGIKYDCRPLVDWY